MAPNRGKYRGCGRLSPPLPKKWVVAGIAACVSLTAGCGLGGGRVPLEDVRISDIGASGDSAAGSLRLIESVNIEASVIEIPVENRQALAVLWSRLDSRPVRLTDADAAAANSLVVRFGRPRDAAGVLDVLEKASARNTKTSSMLFTDARYSEVSVKYLQRPATITYALPGGGADELAIGPGELKLRVEATRISGSQSLCGLNAVFVYRPDAAVPPRREVVFSSTAFGIMMKPGRFVLIGPTRYEPYGGRLADVLFERRGPRPTVAVLLLSL